MSADNKSMDILSLNDYRSYMQRMNIGGLLLIDNDNEITILMPMMAVSRKPILKS